MPTPPHRCLAVWRQEPDLSIRVPTEAEYAEYRDTMQSLEACMRLLRVTDIKRLVPAAEELVRQVEALR